jgi:hypothetical protein
MKRLLSIALIIACAAVAIFAGVQQGAAKPLPRAPVGFFGIDPQGALTPADIRYMKAGGIESIRVGLTWSEVQGGYGGEYNWSNLDHTVALAAAGGIRVLPGFYGAAPGVADYRRMPIQNARQRAGWTAFLKAAVKRYGPGGEFWAEHAPGNGVNYQPAIQNLPIRTWQIWNEANFHYFAYPVSSSRYAKLLALSSRAIKSVDPGAQIILSGLFGRPTAHGKNGMPAAQFLRQLYRKPGIKSDFDGIALHPYAADTEELEEMIEEMHEVTAENHDRPGFYVTEMGWGSQDDPNTVSFEVGKRGQAEELRNSYGYLLENRYRLNLKAAYWFSWKDFAGSCSFCDSTGLFRQGPRFHSKPAWHTFLSFSHGRARP